MTEQQKKAILILNRLHQQFRVSIFNDEDYFLLMDFVVGDKEPQISYIPFNPTPTIDPWGKFSEVTCNQKVEEQQ